MDNDDAISVFSEPEEQQIDRRTILAPAIHDVIAALGGYEGDTYKLGDECYGCLKDLKKFWRKDDTDDERTVARIFWEARVLPKDIVPILLETAGKGLVGDKCAIACADIATAMTWPIDLSEELKELDEELDKGTDYTQLLQSHLHYKSALLRPGVIQALFGILLPCIAKDKKDRKERDGQIVNVVLHLFRNLAFIKDRPPNMHASADQAEFSSLQSKLIKTYSEAHVLDLLITIASSALDPFLNQWNTLVLEIFYLLYRGVLPSSLAVDQVKVSQNALSQLLAAENKLKIENARRASSRHSRFGTTISVSLKPSKARTNKDGEVEPPSNGGTSSQTVVLHRQQALNKDAGSILDIKKRKQFKKINKVDELGLEDNLDSGARNILRSTAKTFVEACFNTFLASLLKDIKSERPKIKEKDHLRLLFATKWFLEFFLSVRAGQIEKSQKKDAQKAGENVSIWPFDLVAEVIERSWIVWVLKRMREAVEDKPKLWTELQAGIECLTQLLQLIDSMHAANISDPELGEAALLLQQQIVYNGEVLDISVDALRVYKEGVQSLRYLDASIRLGYSLLRMLEKWARERGGDELYVRKKTVKRRKAKDGADEEEGGLEEQEDADADAEHVVQEILFTFETFELKFAHEDITHTLLTYLARFDEFTSPEQMKRVVNLIHRQAVKAKAEGLFFKVSTLNLFKSILAKQSTLPREQSYKDLVALINYILRKFFKAVNEDPLLVVEVFFPKNRNRWKQFSSWDPEENKRSKDKDTKETSIPPDVQVKKGHSWSEQLGIAIACLVEKGQQDLIDWVKEILMMVIGQRQRLIEETDGSSSQSQLDDMDDDAVRDAAAKLRQPSNEALAKFQDYSIPCISDEQADAATKNPHLKLVFRLVKFFIMDENADELEWYVPAAILPSDLQSSLAVINQFLETPLDLGDKKATQMLTKKTRRRHRRRAVSDNEDSANSDDEEPRKKRTKKHKEQQQYKSAQFIEDSDAEYGDDEAFWARERALRERTERLAADGKSGTMRATGTKKRKKQRGGGDETKSSKRRKRTPQADSDDEDEKESSASDSEVDNHDTTKSTRTTPATTPPQDTSTDKSSTLKKTKPRPRPRYKGAGTNAERELSEPESPPIAAEPPRSSGRASERPSSSEDDDTGVRTLSRKTRTKARIMLSDEDE
ncbi:hypothetical protein M0805_000267 [Coniferiporia weirii]|nr:hypothetical protein M0805_000267 [Coniferiporia weirii]